MRWISALYMCGISTTAVADIAIQFNDFSNTEELVLNGDAQTAETADGTVMRLTPSLANQAGSVFSETLIEASNFSTRLNGISIIDTIKFLNNIFKVA